ncbi:MAG: beta-lactamase family protein [Fibrobacterales bacterium]
MRGTYLTYIAIILFCFTCCTKPIPEKLTTVLPLNGDFESGLDYWTQKGAKISSDQPKTGGSSLLLDNQKYDYIQADQYVSIPKGAISLRLSAWIRTEDVKKGAEFWQVGQFGFVFLDSLFVHSGEFPEATALVHGTTNWTEYSKSYAVDQKSQIIKLFCAVFTAPAKIWFDKISVQFLDSDSNVIASNAIIDPVDLNQWLSKYEYSNSSMGDDVLKTEPVSEIDVDVVLLDSIVASIRRGNLRKQTSLLISKDNKFIVEEYFNNYNSAVPHTVQSVSKSITSLLMGIAIDKGFVASVNDPISKYLPEYQGLFVGDKADITIKDMLLMAPGLKWNEHNPGYYSLNNIRTREMFSKNSVEFVLKRSLDTIPGVKFAYSGGFVTVIGQIIENATKMTVGEFASQYFFNKLGINYYKCYLQADSRFNTAGGFMVTPQGLMKIGLMVLNNGMYNDVRVVSNLWIKESTSKHLDPHFGEMTGYGYYWWRTSFNVEEKAYDVIGAYGWGGQHIIIIKDLDLVLVTTGDNFQKDIPYTNLFQDIIKVFNSPKM